MTLPPTPHGDPAPDAPGADPSMEDILASIRRILNEDEAAVPAVPAAGDAKPAETPPPADDSDVLVLDHSMIVTPPPLPEPVPEPPVEEEAEHEPPPAAMTPPVIAMAPPAPPPARPSDLLAPESEAAAVSSVGSLLRILTAERSTQVHRGGPTIEDLVREELRPLLKEWLDAHLPPMVERLVRAEIERVAGRAG